MIGIAAVVGGGIVVVGVVGLPRGAPPPHSKGLSGFPPPLAGGASAAMIATVVIASAGHNNGRSRTVAGCAAVAVAAERDDYEETLEERQMSLSLMSR